MHTADEKKYPNTSVGDISELGNKWRGSKLELFMVQKKMVDVLFSWFLMEVQNAPKGFFALAWLDRIKKDWQSLKENVEIPFPDSIQIE